MSFVTDTPVTSRILNGSQHRLKTVVSPVSPFQCFFFFFFHFFILGSSCLSVTRLTSQPVLKGVTLGGKEVLSGVGINSGAYDMAFSLFLSCTHYLLLCHCFSGVAVVDTLR